MFDLFGSHSRYARRNAGNVLKTELEAAEAPEQVKGTDGIPNLSALFSGPVRKATTPTRKAEKLPACIPLRIRSITYCEDGVCETKVKICE